MAEKRKTFAITFNKGIDKASLPFEANPARALDALNYLYRDGKVQKRFGINQLLQAGAVYYRVVGFDGAPTSDYLSNRNHRQINGIWNFLAEDGECHTVVHVGKLLFILTEDGDGFSLSPIKASASTTSHNGRTYIHCYQFEDYKSVAIIGNKSLYFFGGNKLMRLRFPSAGTYSLKPVEDDADTYVPTTTVSITYKNAKASGRASLDQVNLMAQWRRNQLLTGVGIDEAQASTSNDFGYVFQLDGPIVGKTAGDVSSLRVLITRRNRHG